MLDKIIEIIMTILPFLGNSRKKRQISERDACGDFLVERTADASCGSAV